MAAYFRVPFAAGGNKTAVPVTTGDGSVNYTDGYGVRYELPRLTDPLARNIERQKMNQVFFDITSNIQQYQQNGFPDFITSADNGGTAYAYGKGATVRFDDGSGFANYESLIASNTTDPTNATNWIKVGSYSAEAAETAAVAAETAALEAAVSATESADEKLLSQLAAESVAQPWQFNTSTSVADPTTGKVLFNNATKASVTAIVISATTYGTGAKNLRDYINTWDDSTGVNKGILTLQSLDNPATFAKYFLTGAVTDNTSWQTFPVTHIASNGTFASNERFAISFSQNGNKGDAGSGTMNIGGAVTSATAKSILYIDASGNLAQDNDKFVYNYTTKSVGIGTNLPDSKSVLELFSITQGFLPPRMTTTQRNAIASPPEGLIVQDTTDHKLYYRDDIQWVPITKGVSLASFFDPSSLDFFEAQTNGFAKVSLAAAASIAADCVVTLPSVTCVINGSVGNQVYDTTITGSGTTGDQTINKPSGTVNFAAAATSLVVTNSLCTANSIIFAVVRTNDTTAIIKNVTPAAGSFTIRLNAAATAETSVGFFIIN